MDRSSILRASTIVYSKEGAPCGAPSFFVYGTKLHKTLCSGRILTSQA